MTEKQGRRLNEAQREKLANAADERSWAMSADTASEEVLAHADEKFWAVVDDVISEVIDSPPAPIVCGFDTESYAAAYNQGYADAEKHERGEFDDDGDPSEGPPLPEPTVSKGAAYANAAALDDFIASKGVVLDEDQLDWLSDWVESQRRTAIVEHLKRRGEEAPESVQKVADARRETVADWAERMRAKGRKVPDSLTQFADFHQAVVARRLKERADDVATLGAVRRIVLEMRDYKFPGEHDDRESAYFADGFEAGVGHVVLRLRATLGGAL